MSFKYYIYNTKLKLKRFVNYYYRIKNFINKIKFRKKEKKIVIFFVKYYIFRC